jgi:hypothetical protein
MKIKLNQKEPGGVMVELGPGEPLLPGAAPASRPTPLPEFKLRHILVPVDFSDGAKKRCSTPSPSSGNSTPP